MKLYYMTGACPLATQIVLEWIGKPYDLQLVERTALKDPEFLALNPVGSVPVFTDGDLTLTQNVAIMEYLNEKYPEAQLHGKTPEQRAEVRRWLSFVNSDLHRTFSLIFGAQGYSDDPNIQQVLVDKSTERVKFLFGVANQDLANKPYLAGENRSIADPYLYTIQRWAKAKQVDLSDMQNLTAFYTRMDADAGVQAALKKQGLA
ncbi:glutathione S-transferase family protein [Eoetvoesiella caeni]|uniref:Glutathione S-transferase n=1 Tax=Eoetvoesiella caeni TaxID=645616 RepID=A0A366HDV1_9BURK|nr:glutathione binding-like protein [Eoetvoesiella caeni]MCI2808791.1 glutathione S-transferase N-terminal domain-containing protein [Eoetvoesiella caeni]NYT55331.1 glutathione S-transferase N-terminal domain-containing protein [Eoetvoesiella caeni]RBP40687.1 glutathione S-transferase [Eoetvoesiella caeni]